MINIIYRKDILNYLDLYDLCQVRAVNKVFQVTVHEYYKTRLKLEIEYITSFQEDNKEKTEIFMKNIDSQIPISNGGWLDFDLCSVTNKITSLTKNTIIKIKAIKSLGKNSDLIFAPFCIFMGYNVSLIYIIFGIEKFEFRYKRK